MQIDLRASPELPELKHFRKRPTGLRSKVLSASSLFSSSSIFSTSSPDLSLMNSAKFSRSQSEIIDTANSMGDITEVMTEKDMWRQQAKCLQKELLQWKRCGTINLILSVSVTSSAELLCTAKRDCVH